MIVFLGWLTLTLMVVYAIGFIIMALIIYSTVSELHEIESSSLRGSIFGSLIGGLFWPIILFVELTDRW